MKIKEFQSLDSTNTWAKEHIDELDPLCINVIHAVEQTGGRGQFERKWLSSKGKGLYITYAFITPGGESLKEYPIKFAKIVVQVLSTYGVDANIREPNDVYVHGKKISGILTEAREPWCFVGIGINISYTTDELKDVGQPATSIFIETDQCPTIADFATHLSSQVADKVSVTTL